MRLLTTLIAIVITLSYTVAQRNFIDFEPNTNQHIQEFYPILDKTDLGPIPIYHSVNNNHLPSVIYVDLNAIGTNNGSTWENAYTNLQTALDNAAVSDQLWIAQGVYSPEIIDLPTDSNFFRILIPLELYGGFVGNETELHQRDWSNNSTILSGDINSDDVDDDFELNKDDNTMHVVAAQADNIILDGIEISYGKSRITTEASMLLNHTFVGAGLISINDLIIRNCSFKQNYASRGGGTYFYPASNIKIDSSIFDNNRSELGAGAINIGNLNARINASKFRFNNSNIGPGGAIFGWQNPSSIYDSTTTQISNCEFLKNQGNLGGAIAFNNFTTGTYLELDNCMFDQNRCLDNNVGGALSISNSHPQKMSLPQLKTNISNSTFTSNEAGVGSALFFHQLNNKADLSFINNTVENNVNTSNSTIYLVASNESDLSVRIDSSLFKSNSSIEQTGAVYLLNNQMKSGLKYDINNSNFLENNGGKYVGAIDCYSLSAGEGSIGRIRNCKFTKNTAELSCGAISSTNSNTVITDCIFNDNETLNSASAICFTTLLNSNGVASLKNTKFEGNRSTFGIDTSDIWLNNGAIEIWSEGQQSVEIDQCEFKSNKSAGVGGAITIINQEELSVKISNSNFDNNQAEMNAGAILALAYLTTDQLPTVTLESNEFNNNTANSGGAVHLSRTNANVFNCNFIKNSITSNSGTGGALNISNGGTFNIRSCNFKENKSQGGGGAMGIYQNSAVHHLLNTKANITNCTFEGNTATQFGGAMYYANYNRESYITIDSSQFKSNTSGEGGGIYTNSFSRNDGMNKTNLSIQNSNFENNTAERNGGAIYNSLKNDTILFEVFNCTFDSNKALLDNAGTGGGAIANAGESSSGKMYYTISDCDFTNNSSAGISGGLWNTSTTSFRNGPKGVIKNCNFNNNTAKYCCGGLGAALDECIIDNCIFENNTSLGLHPGLPGGGGAGFVVNKDIKITNSIFKNNFSDVEGSALIFASSDKLIVENLLVHDHSGSSALYVDSKLDAKNLSIINNNVGVKLSSQAKVSLQNSLFDNTINLAGNGKIESLGGNLSSDESMSSLLTGNGGFKDFNRTKPLLDQNFTPTESSPCVDAGNDTNISLSTDLNGDNRIQGNTIDIGAYESPFSTSLQNVIWDSEIINVYPNPAHDFIQLQLKSTNNKITRVIIYDQIGIIKIQKMYNSNPLNQNINIEALSAGEYFLIAEDGSNSYAQKFIKK